MRIPAVTICGRCVCFFFSSRRRHTRSYGDWSSDVCSSDLVFVPAYVSFEVAYAGTNTFRGGFREYAVTLKRSEERRVGKECRSRWWQQWEKEKKAREVRTWWQKGVSRMIEL